MSKEEIARFVGFVDAFATQSPYAMGLFVGGATLALHAILRLPFPLLRAALLAGAWEAHHRLDFLRLLQLSFSSSSSSSSSSLSSDGSPNADNYAVALLLFSLLLALHLVLSMWLPLLKAALLVGGWEANRRWDVLPRLYSNAAALLTKQRQERLAYLSDNFFATNPYSSGLLLCVITLALVVCGGLMLWLGNFTPPPNAT